MKALALDLTSCGRSLPSSTWRAMYRLRNPSTRFITALPNSWAISGRLMASHIISRTIRWAAGSSKVER